MNNPDQDRTGIIIGAAIRVHEELGPGFLESFYEEALCVELNLLGLRYQRQHLVPVRYRGTIVGEHRLEPARGKRRGRRTEGDRAIRSHPLRHRPVLPESDKLRCRFAPELCDDHT